MAGFVPASELTETERAVGDAYADGTRLDLSGRSDRLVRGGVLAGLLTGAYPDRAGGLSALCLDGAVITERLDLLGRTVRAVITLSGCRFEQAPRLEMARLIGLSLRGCRVPALDARNLRLESDLCLDSGFRSDGVVDLTDATVDGTVRLAGSSIGGSTTALLAARLRVSGSVQAIGLAATGEVRLRGANVGGSVQLTGATLANPGGDALEATGLTVEGNLMCDSGAGEFDAAGRVVLVGARVGGDVSFAGSRLHDGTGAAHPILITPHVRTGGYPVLAADRLRVEGALELGSGFVAVGTVGLRGARVGGHVDLSGATIGRRDVVPALAAAFARGRHVTEVPTALLADGMEVGGDLEARSLAAHGQVRLLDAHVHGSVSLSGARLIAPAVDVLFADRLRVGGTLFLRDLQARGSVRLQNAHIGSSLDCTGARLLRPGCGRTARSSRRWTPGSRPSARTCCAVAGSWRSAASGSGWSRSARWPPSTARRSAAAAGPVTRSPTRRSARTAWSRRNSCSPSPSRRTAPSCLPGRTRCSSPTTRCCGAPVAASSWRTSATRPSRPRPRCRCRRG